MPTPTVLFFAEAVTLAHVARPIALASALRGCACVHIACSRSHESSVRAAGIAVHPLQSIAPATFLSRLARGQPAYRREELETYVKEDLQLITAIRPDVVVGDFRLSLSVSARLARVPYVGLTNAYWSPFARPDFRMPVLSFARWLSDAIGDPLFRLTRPFAFAAHSLPLNSVRRAHGLAALPLDVRHVYCDADLVLYADLPQLMPLHGSPPNHRHIGPVPWSPAMDLPPWWDKMMRGERVIYVSLGSSGDAGALPGIVQGLKTLGRPIVVTTAGRGQLPSTDGIWVADFLPGDQVCSKACVVVCNGGSPTSMQALTHGVPVVGLASNLDQVLNMGYVQRFGAGLLVRASHASPKVVCRAVESAARDDDMRQRAETIRQWARDSDAGEQFVASIRQIATSTDACTAMQSP